MPRFLLLALLLAACASEPAEVPAAPEADVSVPTPEADGTDAPEGPTRAPRDASDWTSGIVDLGASGEGQAVLTDVRVATHDGYDRVAFEFESVRPAVHVEYVDRPVRACGSGEVVELPGDGWLLVRFRGARAHTAAGEATVDPATRDLGLPTALALARTCDFEGEVSWVVAASSPEPVRVTTLDGPPRVAVDLRHPAR
ncbi:AMIN-like domain-containing (lipo)protein [Rubrivirga marina]|uniref:AMIN-like domain-containing protein n=1 Tax=Rubrivirga marina TaxID=1196024 RepID=A0A271J4T8_9BACT|nr:hypothetical protein [Rubrivirga marina]PAP78074.1 hypothetical protein BSZ37_17335 [Rubrivirga marina]